MRTEKSSEASPQTIMQAFRLANDMVAESKTLDEMISAYDRVINFCSNSASCRAERSTRRDMLLYWAYDNIAKAYRQKGVPEAALLYYEKALAAAPEDAQKSAALEKMLDIVGAQNLCVSEKCRKILGIVNRLTAIYKNKPDKTDLRRITALGEKTLNLLKKAEN